MMKLLLLVLVFTIDISTAIRAKEILNLILVRLGNTLVICCEFIHHDDADARRKSTKETDKNNFFIAI